MASVYNLEQLVHKGVRTKDGTDLGNVIATDEANVKFVSHPTVKETKM